MGLYTAHNDHVETKRMTDAIVLTPGLHVCTSLSQTPEGNLEGVECDLKTYLSMKILYACVVGRPPTVNREIHFFLNDSIVEKAEDRESANMMYMHSIDDRFVGSFRIVYVENGCNYWAREFMMGVCPASTMRPDIEVSRLVDLLRKFRS